jgi:hypothetical protein
METPDLEYIVCAAASLLQRRLRMSLAAFYGSRRADQRLATMKVIVATMYLAASESQILETRAPGLAACPTVHRAIFSLLEKNGSVFVSTRSAMRLVCVPS